MCILREQVVYVVIYMIHVLRFRVCKFFILNLNLDCLEFVLQSLEIRTETSTTTLAMALTATRTETDTKKRPKNSFITSLTTSIKIIVTSVKINKRDEWSYEQTVELTSEQISCPYQIYQQFNRPISIE